MGKGRWWGLQTVPSTHVRASLLAVGASPGSKTAQTTAEQGRLTLADPSEPPTAEDTLLAHPPQPPHCLCAPVLAPHPPPHRRPPHHPLRAGGKGLHNLSLAHLYASPFLIQRTSPHLIWGYWRDGRRAGSSASVEGVVQCTAVSYLRTCRPPLLPSSPQSPGRTPALPCPCPANKQPQLASSAMW